MYYTSERRMTYFFRVAGSWRQVTVRRTGDADADLDAALTILYRRYPGARVEKVK